MFNASAWGLVYLLVVSFVVASCGNSDHPESTRHEKPANAASEKQTLAFAAPDFDSARLADTTLSWSAKLSINGKAEESGKLGAPEFKAWLSNRPLRSGDVVILLISVFNGDSLLAGNDPAVANTQAPQPTWKACQNQVQSTFTVNATDTNVVIQPDGTVTLKLKLCDFVPAGGAILVQKVRPAQQLHAVFQCKAKQNKSSGDWTEQWGSANCKPGYRESATAMTHPYIKTDLYYPEGQLQAFQWTMYFSIKTELGALNGADYLDDIDRFPAAIKKANNCFALEYVAHSTTGRNEQRVFISRNSQGIWGLNESYNLADLQSPARDAELEYFVHCHWQSTESAQPVTF
jgi:hypothetical protein